MKLEICCYSIEDIKIAFAAGADRIEFCAGRSDGGLTPSYGDLVQLSELKLPIPIHPIIRPRGGDFYYNQTEINTMLKDIELIKELGFSGVVFGALDVLGNIDTQNITRLIKASAGLSMTFHRAFDVCNNPLMVQKQLEDLGFNRLLTSGQKATAIDGIGLIEQLNKQSQSMIIMPGCGVKSNNIQQLLDVGVTECHSSASKTIDSPMQYINQDVSMSHSQNSEFLRYVVDANEVKKMQTIIAHHTAS
ncbi:copper homeostasis protein CutC [Orbus mooreae]